MKEDKIKEAFEKVREDMNYFFQEIQEIKRTLEELKNPTSNAPNPTQFSNTPTLQHSLEAPKPKDLPISTGNGGVPTNKPTNQQTNQHPPISPGKFALNEDKQQPDRIAKLQEVSRILDSLDELKKDIRTKFKKLTAQEMIIFSTIYQLEEMNIEPTYGLIAEKLNLSEISVRDYVRKIIKKGVPVDKIKKENNRITLAVSQDLRKIASLSTIIELREL